MSNKGVHSFLLSLLISFLISILLVPSVYSECKVIPRPAEMKMNDGYFTVNQNTNILYDDTNPEIYPVAEYLAETINRASGFKLKVKKYSDNRGRNNSIIFSMADDCDVRGKEGYNLQVTSGSVQLYAEDASGLFWGMQTIRQLLPVEIENSFKAGENVTWTIPCLSIKDFPQYRWRGLMMDCSRTFQTLEYLRRYIDLLSYYKMNCFHLHLTDDNGWRIESRKYPKLNEIGSWRIEKDGSKSGGYYTQDELRELVAYAEKRQVMIIPEVEMPGHSVAAVASYPELSCKPGPFKVLPLPVTKLYEEGALCAGKEFTFRFLEDVLSEVIDIFPSPYIHIGGDECVKTHWEECEKCQERIRNEGLKDEDELQSYFIKRIEKFLNEKGKILIGWDEILEGGLAQNAAVMFWRAFKGLDGVMTPAMAGHDVVMSPTSHCYLDYNHEKISLQKAYSLEPTPKELPEDKTKHIIGVQGNMWTHLALTEPEVDKQIFPRLIALAEVAWTPDKRRNWEDFSNRILDHYRVLDLMGVKYTPHNK